MPNYYNFDGIKDLRTVEVNPQGWISPLFVEYGSGLHGGIPSYFWRVKGTYHTFVIPILRMDFISKGEYVKHFNEILESFKEDYIGWSKEGWYTEWMQQYREDYRSYITL